jgi:hypothetical protein
MHQSPIFKIFKGVAPVALLLLLAAPALASTGHNVPDGSISQSRQTVRDIQRKAAGTATHTVLNAILARNSILHGFSSGGAAPAGATGASGGDGGLGFGVWASGGWQHVNNSSSQWSRGGMLNVTGGFDVQFGSAVVGVAVGGEWLRLDMSDSGRYESDGFSVTPNFSFAILPDLVLDGAVGVTWLNNYQKSGYISTANGTQPGEMEADFFSWRIFTAAGLTKFWTFDNWVFSGRLGALYLYQEIPSYTLRGVGPLPFANDTSAVEKNRSDLFQLSATGRVGYQIGDFTPFVSATYLQDISKSGKQNDFVGGNFEAGFNYRIGAVSLGLTAVYGVRYQYQNVGGMANFRWDF